MSPTFFYPSVALGSDSELSEINRLLATEDLVLFDTLRQCPLDICLLIKHHFLCLFSASRTVRRELLSVCLRESLSVKSCGNHHVVS